MRGWLLVATLATLSACVEGDNDPPTVLVSAPASDTTVSRGGTLPISYTDNDPGGAATSLYLEPAGVLAGGGPYLIAGDRPVQGPQGLTFRWDPASIPAGDYLVVAVTSDGTSQVVAEAPGIVTLADVSRVRSDGGNEPDAAHAIAALPDGSTFLAGSIQGTSTFGAGEAGETSLTALSVDLVVARYRADGTLAWAKRAGSPRADFATGVAAFADGSCVVTGHFDRTATFGEGEANETDLICLDDSTQAQVLGGRDIFVARFGANGTLAWAKQASGLEFEMGTGIASLPDGSCVVTGWFGGDVTFGAGEANQTVLSGVGGSDVFVARYDANGTLAWARHAGGAGTENGLGVAALPDGTSVVSGFFTGSATFGAGEAGETTVTTTGTDAFVACYEPDGRLRWVAQATGADAFSSSYAFAVAVAPGGSVVVAGRIGGEVTFGAGETNETTLTSANGSDDIFVARYDAGGHLLWAKRAGGTDALDQANGIAALPDGSAVVTGQLGLDAGTFGPGEAGETVISGARAFVARYNADGTLAWAKGIAGSAIGKGVAVLPDESPLVTGFFHQTVTFGPGEPGETMISVVPGDDEFTDSDLFLALYNADGSF